MVKRKFLTKKTIVATTLLAMQLNVLAQNQSFQGDTLYLDLDQAIKIGIDQNPTIRIADMEIEKADYSKKAAISSLLPQVTAVGDYTHYFKKVTATLDNTWAAGFTASLPLVNVPLWETVKLTNETILQKAEAARQSKITQISSIIEAYYKVINAQDSYDVMLKSYNTAQESYRITQKKFEQGMTAEYDVIQSEVQVRNIQPTLANYKNGIELAYLQLKVLMSLPSDYPIKIQGTLADYANNEFTSMDASQVDTTLSSNPDMRMLNESEKLLQKQLNLQKASWYPIISLQAGYQWVNASDDLKIPYNQWNPLSTAEVTLAWPLFTGGSRYYKQKQAEIDLKEIQFTKENTRRGLNMQLQSAVDNLNVAVEKIESAKIAVSLAEKGLQISRKRYEVGSGTTLEITSSENALTQASLSYYQTLYDYIIAKNRVNEVLGNAYEQYINK